MDRYFKASTKPITCSELHEIGIVCMFIASKYQDVRPLFLSKVASKIAHGKISEAALKLRELDILKVLNYDIQAVTPIEFLDAIANDIAISLEVYNRAKGVLYLI
jgi:hypothetical protein